MKYSPLLLCVAALWIATPGLPARDDVRLPLKPSAPYAWWTPGEPIVFKPGGFLPKDLASLQGQVYGANGLPVTQIEVSKDDFQANGWVWKGAEPGFYDIEFFVTFADGSKAQVTDSFTRRAPNGKEARFERKKYSVAVVARPEPGAARVGQFGWQYHLNEREIPLAQLVGYEFTMIHSIPWGANFTNLADAIEPARDEYRWDKLDSSVKALADAGFEIGGQFCYTPTWASPYPEKEDKINICVRESAAYAPKDMSDFTSFVEKTVERYKDHIRIWEIWNEPNLPGSSCFWNDTPANFVRLQRAGYETIKRLQPEAEVWNGGLGMRISYVSFYDKILKGGVAPYYDKLSLHAISTDVGQFREVERRYNAPEKSPVVSEWHAILIGSGVLSGPPASESALSLRMMKDLLNQIKQGVVRTVIFEMTNQVEKEVVSFAAANKWFTHSAGLFRQSPRIEPRHAAVVKAVFLTLTGKKATFEKEIALGDNGTGILLKTNHGDMLVVWTEEGELSAKDLKAFQSSSSKLHDWEGREVALNDATELKPGIMYYLSSPDAAALAKAAPSDHLQPVNRQKRSSAVAPSAVYAKAGLPAELPDSDPRWIAKDWTWVPYSDKESKISARAAVGTSESGVDILIEVKDATHVQKETSGWWNGDSVQVAFDCEGNGMFGSNTEAVCALTPDGVVFRKISNANVEADLPARRSAAGDTVEFGKCEIKHEGDLTTYRIHFDWSELNPLAYNPDAPLKISLLVNNNDGSGRAGYLEWGSGLGAGEKDPSQFGTLKPTP